VPAARWIVIDAVLMALVALYSGLSALSAQAPVIAFVQANSSVPQSPQVSVTVPYALVQSAGNLNVVVVGWNDSTAHIQTIGDTQGNVYNVGHWPYGHLGRRHSVNLLRQKYPGSRGGSQRRDGDFDQAAQLVDIRTAEYRGIDSVNPLDVAVAESGNNSTSYSGQRTTTNAAPASVAAFTDRTSPRTIAVTSPASTFYQPTKGTLSAFTMAAAASIIPTRPWVSIIPRAS
jgi:anaerobic selenocysteine-containing dehydrogenase